MYDECEAEDYYEQRTEKADQAFDVYLDLACTAAIALVLYKLFQHLF